MNMMSSGNSFYRYRIEGSDDLSEECYERRERKACQNNKAGLFFEPTVLFDSPERLCSFLKKRLRPTDAVLLDLNQYRVLDSALPLKRLYLRIGTIEELNAFTKYSETNPAAKFCLLFTPKTKPELKACVQRHSELKENHQIYWRFQPYNPSLPKSLTVSDINGQNIKYETIPGLEIHNTFAPAHYELEPNSGISYFVDWKYQVAGSNPHISVIIPTFNNVVFLSNVLWHLINQKCDKTTYEIIVTDDGSTDGSSVTLQNLFEAYRTKVNLTYIYWSKSHPHLGEQRFFRSGLARNLAARYSVGQNLVFLDSDMIVPENFIAVCLAELKKSDLIQFQRFHIHQEQSKRNPHYNQVSLKNDTYIEESNYWSQLFYCRQWDELPHYWKYTCTYALGIARANFFELGMFKKYYISYGFEDTDLGYEAFKRKLKFSLVKTPLLHLTAYDQMQYKNSTSKRVKLLKVTAELFFLQHLDREIYYLLNDYFRMQKSFKAFFRDLVT